MKIKSLSKLSQKEILRYILWAEKEIAQYQQFIKSLKAELEKKK